ncbi:hypothetical protein Spb1_20400 [Planctopirus ephydatiae]|uniref:PKD domain-containing protein n=1 Tax=Planctopirus ephydatiae TaxID=2528019 RepID=A0A518GN89_9PLAN|nr:hypothetical protein [Planctopirus ephydatiae]QDV30112.1 hypothetical protein Spb1_20400 [Planctopirus ephydatiae]
MNFLKIPSPPPMVKSFLLGLSGALIAYLGQWLTSTDFGVYSPLVAAFAPVLVNYLTKLRNGDGKSDGGDDDDNDGTPAAMPSQPSFPLDPLLANPFTFGRSRTHVLPMAPPGVKWLPLGLMALLLCLSLVGCDEAAAGGRPPRAVITGPTRGEPGEFLEFSSRSSENSPTHVRWTIAPELKGRKQLSSTEATDITAAGFPGTYILTLSVSNQHGVDTTSRQYVVDGRQPTPPPEPRPVNPDPLPPAPEPVKPVPQPDPPSPSKTFGVASKLTAALKSINRPNRASDLSGVIGEARAAAKAMEAGSLDPTSAIQRLAAALEKLPADYKPLLLVIVSEIKRVYGEGLLKTPLDYAALFLEAAIALESVT